MNKEHYDKLTNLAKELRSDGDEIQRVKAIFIENNYFEMLEAVEKQCKAENITYDKALAGMFQITLTDIMSRIESNEDNPLMRVLMAAATKELFDAIYDSMAMACVKGVNRAEKN